MVQDDEVIAEIPLTEALDFEYTVDSVSKTHIYYFVTGNRLELGQTGVSLDEMDRTEKVAFEVK